MSLRCVSFPNSSSGAVSGASVHLSMCELVAMMVPALLKNKNQRNAFLKKGKNKNKRNAFFKKGVKIKK